MSKYSNEFKLKVVQYHNKQKLGIESTAKYFNIPSVQTVRKWVKRYQEHGTKGLLKNCKSSYSGMFKQNVVKYMHENHLSLQETAFHFNLEIMILLIDGNVYIMRKGHKHFTKSDVVEKRIWIQN